MLFQQSGKTILPDKIISTNDLTQYMCVAAHNGCLVAGDSEGWILFFSPEFEVYLRPRISEVRRKTIGVGTNLVVLHAADCQAFVITLPRGNGPEGLRVSSIPMNPVVVAVADAKDLIALWTPGGRLTITNFKDVNNKLDSLPRLSALVFTPDSTGLVMGCPNSIRFCSVKLRKASLFPRQGLMITHSLICLGRSVTGLTASRIYTWPILFSSASRVPVLYGASRLVTDTRTRTNRAGDSQPPRR
jgi:hypothetical protein